MYKKIIMLFAMVLFVCSLTGCGTKEVELSQFFEVKYDGSNGDGKVNVNFDFPAFEEYLLQNEEETLETSQWIKDFEATVKMKVDKKEGLSNGDEITVTMEYDDLIPKKNKYNFIGASQKIVIDSLNEVTEIDVFDGLQINYFKELSPYVKIANFDNENCPIIQYISFSADKMDNLEKGEKILVSVKCDEEEIRSKGYVITEMEKEVTIDDVDEYVLSYEQLSSDTLEQMDSQIEEYVKNITSGSVGYFTPIYPEGNHAGEDYDSVEIIDFRLVNSIFFYPKEKGKSEVLSNTANNGIYFIYQMDSKDCISPEGITSYWIIAYKDVIVKKDGQYSWNDPWCVGVFRNFDMMMEDEVYSAEDKYNITEHNN